MQDKTDSNWPRFMRTPEAARLLGLSPRTLEKYRCEGMGPIYHKLGGRVVYTVTDLVAWIDACARRSTCEPLLPSLSAPRDGKGPDGSC
ncbi:helix-turn-helix domain-containing protein [Chelativorans sp. AA-79]|uniref:helix-turn-helix transcriptional regulator n=1 Tax=Chelativorans sp. AA-79 TaxID=3028735 RepID=UPI0023FA15B9|nr:helix-turn-helix domain-containing protein [Chelativorans sp. AA-79]WEX08504.1 helix-turn-helix domain-containing protein [Chelativorans sp. AA-79]